MEGNLLACYGEDFFPDGKLENRTPSSHALDLVFLSSVIPGMAAPLLATMKLPEERASC